MSRETDKILAKIRVLEEEIIENAKAIGKLQQINEDKNTEIDNLSQQIVALVRADRK